ncbi:hypothetical protein M422DRAFT_37518 [Sphaerobolus stellatus SS14]|uniref:Unplaced genomic scaffold SPHSTscaffold_245, whole genome shotgun sequence n=1 Tax=Sphaerobolus stellatus (strain SS14) TaxID=990650 RepID=A0A0C9URH5_SPHS4|nr:hypothetical protein M422DRAFT_37518 [Sphaerobolus stellatus SS14]
MPLQVTLFSDPKVPNPFKIAIFLEELNVEYEVITKLVGHPDSPRSPEFLKHNPLGQVPVIIDHTNNNLVVWESAVIFSYFAERFSSDGRYAEKTPEEKNVVSQWPTF